jgi:hypothetical protein
VPLYNLFKLKPIEFVVPDRSVPWSVKATILADKFQEQIRDGQKKGLDEREILESAAKEIPLEEELLAVILAVIGLYVRLAKEVDRVKVGGVSGTHPGDEVQARVQ